MLELTDRAKLESLKSTIEPQLVLEIDGIDTIFGAVSILKYIKIGDPDLYIGDDWVIGGLNAILDQESIISLEGTGSQISQQLRPDQGNVSSVSGIEVSLVDLGGLVTEIISPGIIVDDILGRKAKLWFGFKSTGFKEDFVVLFKGIIDDVQAGPGAITLTLSHPDQKKRQLIFVKKEREISANINSLVTSIPIAAADEVFTIPYIGPNGSTDPAITHCVRIDDEIIKYTGATSTDLTGCTRGYLSTVATSHAINTKAESFYVLEGDAVTLALKIMLSSVNDYFQTGVSAKNFVQVDPLTNVANSIFFEGIDVVQEFGLSVGDYVTVTGATNGANNFTLKQITSIVDRNDGSYIVLSGVSLVSELSSPALVSFRSQYDTFGEGLGLGMTPDEVDVDEHHYWRDLVLSDFDYQFFLKDTMNAKDFLDKEIYAPCGGYSVPRQGQSSMGYTIGPVPRNEQKILTKDNIKFPDKIKVRRTISRNFYNTILFGYDELAIEDKFETGRVYADGDSRTRIPVGAKTLQIVSKGLRTSLNADAFTQQVSNRYLGRYKFAAEFIENIEVFFKDGIVVDPGDLVILDPTDLKIVNTVDGNRNKPAKYFEVINKSIDLKTGNIKLQLVDTNFDASERYGLISPSSVVVSGTTTYAIIQDSYYEYYENNEPKKWEAFVGLPVLVHNEDYSFSEEIIFAGFDTTNSYKMIFDGALSSPVLPGWIIDIPNYSTSTDQNVNALYKVQHAHQSPVVSVVSGISNTQFTVAPGDVAKFQVDFPIRVYNAGFVLASDELKVTDVTGVTITVSDDMGFTPTSSFFADFLGFADSNQCYRYV